MANLYEQFRLESMPGGGVEIVHFCYRNIICVDDMAEAFAYVESHTCEEPRKESAARLGDTLVKQVYESWMSDFARPLLVRFPRNDCE